MSVGKNNLVDSLTRREQDVLELMAQAHSNKEIASQLMVSIETVRTHAKRIYAKLGVSGRHEATLRATQLGIIQQDTSTTEGHIHRKLQVTYDKFVGRDSDLSALSQLFQRGERLVTIVGVGGMGKTRLAIEFAQQNLKHYQHGGYLIELESVQDKQSVILQIADSLPIKLTGSDSPSDQILDFLRDKHLLLVVDNCEHVLHDLDFLGNILESAPDVQLIATSRVRLSLSREAVYDLRGLSVTQDDPNDTTDTSDAIQLMLRFARRIQPNWTITDDNRQVVYDLCRVTQGMPLAIILAVGWLDVYPLERILKEIQQNVDFLETDLRDVPERHQSMRAVFDWTWQLLSDDERDVLMKFSVFRNGGMLDAVEKITGAPPTILKSLMNKSLIQRDPNRRYRMHPLQRQYCAGKLEADISLATETQDAHASYYIHLSADMMTNKLYGDTVQVELDNLLAAWYWAVKTEQTDLLWEGVNNYGIIAYQLGALLEMLPLYQYAIDQLSVIEHQHLIGCLHYVYASFLAYLKEDTLASDATHVANQLLSGVDFASVRPEIVYATYHYALVIRYHSQDKAIAQVNKIIDWLNTYISNKDDVALTMLGYAYSQVMTINVSQLFHTDQEVEIYGFEALRIAKQINHRFLIAYSTQFLGELFFKRKDYETARQYLLTSYETYIGLPQNFDYIFMLTYLGKVSVILGFDDEARQYWYNAMSLFRNYRFLHGLYVLILGIIEWKIQLGDLMDATKLLGFCDAHLVRKRDRAILEEIKSVLIVMLDTSTYERMLNFGRSLEYEVVVTELTAWLED